MEFRQPLLKKHYRVFIGYSKSMIALEWGKYKIYIQNLAGNKGVVYDECNIKDVQDGLYKILPVTLDFAKALSRVAKQDLVVYDRPYNFRYFM